MKNLLVLTDFSDNAAHAAAYALQFGEKIKANLSLCNAFREPVAVLEMSGGMYVSPDEYTLFSNNSLLELDKLKKNLDQQEENNKETSGFRPEVNVISSHGNLADVIKEVILKEDNELIVIGAHDKKGLSDILLSNNVKNLIQDINFPLLVIPFNASFTPIKKIGFAIDLQNEELDVAAVHKLVSFAKPLDASIMLIHIYRGLEEKLAAKEQLKNVIKAVANQEGVPQITSVLYDEEIIKEGLLEVCKIEGIDLLAMVHQHHGFLSRVFSSGNTGRITDYIQIPLLVLPHEPVCVE